MPLPIDHNKPMRFRASTLLAAFVVAMAASPSYAAPFNGDNNPAPAHENINHAPSQKQAKIVQPDDGISPPPPVLADLEEQTQGDEPNKGEQLGLQIRADAMREAALSYGARGGLAHRTYEIQRRLAEYDTSLSKTFNFSRLLIPEASGLLVEPPIVSSAERAVIVKSGGQAAATADRVYRINHAARIVTAARNWRLYLERDWGRVEPPPSILLPRDENERVVWRAYVKQGWDEGVKQAEDTYEADLDRMNADFIGMIRYRELLAQGMISPPFTLADDRGITGGGSEMRVGDRGLAITGQSQLIPRSKSWTPAPRQ